MPEVLTLDQAAEMLDISRRRLYDWMLEANIAANSLPTNARVKTLTLAQVEQLARTHARTLKPIGFEAIRAELADTRERLARLETQVAAFQMRLQTLEAFQATLMTPHLQSQQEEQDTSSHPLTPPDAPSSAL